MGIFNPENGIYRYTEKMADFLILSVFWLVCSLPVVTIGPATAALYHTVVHCIRGNERNSWAMFFLTFRSNLKVGVLTTLVILPIGVVLVFLQGLLYQAGVVDNVGYTLYYAYLVFLLLPIGVGCYLFPVLSRFTFQVSGLLVTCCKLAIANLPQTVLLALIFSAGVIAGSFSLIFIFLLPTVVAFFHSLILERIFKPYIDAQNPPDPDEEPDD